MDNESGLLQSSFKNPKIADISDEALDLIGLLLQRTSIPELNGSDWNCSWQPLVLLIKIWSSSSSPMTQAVVS